ncbi:MAG: hypothetical protein HC936_16915 [Leptolyngbyaceae cyanobacterium SU_3_3]|nr:hypothetical protein [Leptolyngbyaceae cyanobacterium SU_3_3]
MPKPTLFVCQSCHRSSEERLKDQPADGTQLLNQLKHLDDLHHPTHRLPLNL